MNAEIRIKIENALAEFNNRPIREASTHLLNVLGYHSKRIGSDELDNGKFEQYIENALNTANPSEKLRIDDWQAYSRIMQVADEEINSQTQPHQTQLFESNNNINENQRTSYMFSALQLDGDTYTRTQLADMTRFICKDVEYSIMMMFRYVDVLSIAIINRRLHKRDPNKQVLEKVTLIKDINLNNPNRAHVDILSELHLQRLIQLENVRNFDSLHDTWVDILDTEPLNRKFYTELYKWYGWAVEECKFPDDDNDKQVIRMITRLLFIWFLREKQLVPEDIFELEDAYGRLNNFSMDTSAYYQAVLQNLFFATLNTPIQDREYSTRDQRNHRDGTKYRYEDLLQDHNGFLEHLKQVPFVNGGLFDNLDTFESEKSGGERVDCFTDNPKHRDRLHVPAKLFLDKDEGLFSLFSKYKFTIEENTPVEQEVALDPELLGKVFENLLGAFNPETQSTARKATGSYYTPRQIVDYMVDESLIAYFLQKVTPEDGNTEFLEDRLREDLLTYHHQGHIGTSDDHLIYPSEVAQIIEAINALNIIDPAVGSGAFPMGILNKLVLILRKLDPKNEHWKERQLAQADTIDDPESRESAKNAIEQVFSEANRFNDYGRKLYLIQNCIYGVDIQPIAITIAKLRFFISLIIEQSTNDNQDANYGIRPLPNLETKFVAANTLIGLKELNESEFQQLLGDAEINGIRQQIAKLRARHFNANTRQDKLDYMKQEKACREKLSETLAEKHEAWCLQQQNKIEDIVSQLPNEQVQQELREKLLRQYVTNQAKFAAGLEEADKIAHWDGYNQNTAADFFEPDWMFGVEKGFDIVIGNPPYIRHERIRHLKPALQRQFDNFFTNTADISVYFYNRGVDLLRNGGFITYISTNKFIRSGYGRNLRQFLISDMSLHTLLDLGSIPVFDAAVDTCIVLAENSTPTSDHCFRTVILRKASNEIDFRTAFQTHAFPVPIEHFSSDEWTVAHPDTLILLQNIQNIGRSFDEVVQGKFFFGIKTGCNDAFIIDAATRDSMIADDINNNQIIKPLLRGRDIRRWKAAFDDKYLITIASSSNREWPWSNSATDSDAEQIFEETYPIIYQHLLNYRDRLTRRDDQGTFYWELRSCAYYGEFNKPKIVYPDISSTMRACYDTTKSICLQTTYILPTNDFSLFAILNSKLFDWFAKYRFQSLNDPWTGGGIRFIAQYMQHVPIAERTQEQKAELSEIVEQILDEPNSEKVTDLEKEIDEIVYRLYGLSRNEIALIKQTYREAGMDV